jgi:arylsulfatase A-like enzyme
MFGHTPPPLTTAERQSLTWKAPLPIGLEDQWGVRYALTVARKVHPRLLMINLPETDTWGHWYGPDNQKIFRELMLGVDSAVGEIEQTYKQMGILDHTDFIITADHGMMESYPAHSWHSVWTAAVHAGTHVVRADSEGGAVWLRDSSKAKQTAENLAAMAPAHVEAIFYRSSMRADYHFVLASPMNWLVSPKVADALTRLVDTTGGPNGPDIWVLYRENYTVVPRNVSGVWKGTHGGSSWKVQHIPLIMAGPGIRTHIHSEFPGRPIDLTPTIEHLLGLPPIKRDGVVLADALTDPTHAEVLAQNDASIMLDADVDALQAQSTFDDHLPAPHWTARSSPIVHCTTDPKTGKQSCVIPGVSPTNG